MNCRRCTYLGAYNIMKNNQIVLQKHVEILTEISHSALNIKEHLIEQMRNDLNKI